MCNNQSISVKLVTNFPQGVYMQCCRVSYKGTNGATAYSLPWHVPWGGRWQWDDGSIPIPTYKVPERSTGIAISYSISQSSLSLSLSLSLSSLTHTQLWTRNKEYLNMAVSSKLGLSCKERGKSTCTYTHMKVQNYNLFPWLHIRTHTCTYYLLTEFVDPVLIQGWCLFEAAIVLLPASKDLLKSSRPGWKNWRPLPTTRIH